MSRAAELYREGRVVVLCQWSHWMFGVEYLHGRRRDDPIGQKNMLLVALGPLMLFIWWHA